MANPAEAYLFISKAREFLAGAEAALDADNYDSALLLAVHAAISASDAAGEALVGLHSKSSDHLQAVKFLESVSGGSQEVTDKAKQLKALIQLKNKLEYQSRRTKREEAQTGVLRAQRLVEWADDQVRKGS